MSRILVVADMQNDFIRGLENKQVASNLVTNIREKIQDYVSTGDRVWLLRNSKERLTTTGTDEKCIIYTLGWNIVKDLYTHNNLICIHNLYADSYRMFVNMLETEIVGHAENGTPVEEIQIVGMNTASSIVMVSLLLRTLFPEVKITVDAECCACVSDEEHRAGLVTLKACSIGVKEEVKF